MSETRIMREIEELYRNPPDYVTGGPKDDNIYHWEATIQGPDDTYYKDGVFILDIQIPKEYPFKPPICKFKTKIYHPNIDENTGSICLNVLKDYNWNPNHTISNILLSIMTLLAKPNFSSPLNPAARDLYNKSQEEYKNKISEFIKKYSGLENTK